MDWSNNDLAYASCLHTQQPTSYTWRDLNYSVGSYPYGKLDYIIYSSDVINVDKSFSLDTKFMSQKELNNNNLNPEDSRGSDHLAITADFYMPILLNEDKNENIFKKVLKKINLIGQNVRSRGDFSINLYNDGTVKKIYQIQ